ncbi:CHAT domain-containing protein [Ekhidna sp.]
MNRFLIATILMTLSIASFSQNFFKKLKEAVEEQVEDVDTESLINKDDRMADFRQKQLVKDTSNYNYIFSQGNRASFFANREGKESLLLTFAKNYEDEEEGVEAVDLEIYEQAFDSNRGGEMSIYVNQSFAYTSFLEALGLLTNELSFSEVLLDSAFVITDLVDMDTLNVPEKYALGKTVANISILTHAEGKYNLSEELIKQTTNYFSEEIGLKSIALASLNNNHAVIAQSQGRYTEAEKYFEEAEKIIGNNDRIGSLSHAIITSNKALLYNEIGQFEEAKSAIQKAIDMASGEIRSKGRDNVSFQINQGLIHYSAGEYAVAENIFRKIIELKEKRFAKNQTDVGNTKNYLAATLMESGNTDEVEQLLKDALSIFEKKYNRDHPAYVKTEHNLARYQLFVGNLSEAARLLESVNAKYEDFFGVKHPDYLSSLEDMAVVSWKSGDISQATNRFNRVISSNLQLVEDYFGAMSEYEKGQYWAKVRPSILKYYAFAVENGKSNPELLTEMYNIHLKTKGILLSASTKVREQILNSNDEKLKLTYNQWVESKENLIHYYSFSKAQLTELEIDLPALEAEANSLEKKLNQLSSSFAQSNKLPSISLTEVKSKLGSADAAIEIVGYPVFDRSFTGGRKYAFLIATLDSVNPEVVVIDNGQDLETKYAKAYLNMVKLKAQDRITYDKFWRPVDEQLKGKKNIHLSLDGVYFQVNIGALQRPDGSFVSDALNLNLYSSTRDLVKSKNTEFASKKADFFGYPDFGTKGLLAALPGTKTEIEAVSQITRTKGFATNTYMQNQATEENFKRISSPSLLHIATHGFFLPESKASGDKVFGVEVNQAKDNPLLRSGLMLANAEQTMGEATQGTEVNTSDNGVLTAYEVITLDLKDTDLVVLSACETGLGEIKSGEGVYGLQRAFQVAGAESVIMSLWKVSDEATMQLMTSFYKEWMGGKRREEAFFAAQKTLRESFPEPYYWGAFVMLN